MKLFILLCALFVTCLPVVAQDAPPSLKLPEVSQFYFDALGFRSDSAGTSRLDVYLEVPYEGVQFVRDGDIYAGTYEVTLTILDSLEKQVVEKFWREKLTVKDFTETISSKMSKLSQKTFHLPPNRYIVSIQVRDTETGRTSKGRRAVRLRNFSTTEFEISDPMLVSRLEAEGEKKVVYPNISGNVGDLNESFHMFFEAYNPTGADSARIWANVKDVRGEIIQRDTTTVALNGKETSCFPKISNRQLAVGDYLIEVQAVPFKATIGDNERGKSAYASRRFTIRWRGVPASIVDLDKAIDQMQYILEKEKLEEIKDAPTEDKRRLFSQFWKRRDPTPNTERNELMEEYYGRVMYANKHFGHYNEGWKTDMGMVYIIFGAPSNIERHPFDIDSKPYEIWTYYEENREFVFVDATGFGDYRLQTPMWDVWMTRPR